MMAEAPRPRSACQAEGCPQEMDPARLFCPRCWSKVPYPLRLEMVRHFRAARASSGPRRYRHRRAARRVAREAALALAALREKPRRRRGKEKA